MSKEATVGKSPIGRCAAAAAFLAILASACSGGGGGGSDPLPSASATPTPSASATPFVAPTVTPASTPTPVVPTSGLYTAFGGSDVADPTSWIYTVASNAQTQYGITITVDDLGISGAVSGPSVRAWDPTDFPADVLDNEVPSLPANSKYITLFAVVNDIDAAVLHGNVDETTFVATYATSFNVALGFITGKAPQAKVVVINSPNLAGLPYSLQYPTATRQLLQEYSNAADDQVIDLATLQGIPVVDVRCNPLTYNPANFQADGLHPGPVGKALLASLVTPALFGSISAPPTSCAQTALI